MKENLIKCVLWVAAVLSTMYILMTGWYNVPSLDDYGFIADVERIGLWNLIKTMYLTWQCRFSTFFVNGIIWLIFGRSANLIGVTILLLCTGWLSVALLFKGIACHYNWQISSSLRWLMTILTTNIGVLAFLEPSTFYWLCALNYTIAIWATIFLVYFIFFSTTRKWLTWIGAILSAVYISGSAENYAPLVIMVLGLVFLARLVQQQTWKWWIDDSNNLLFVSLLVLCAGFLAMLLGPGNKVRLGSEGGSLDLTEGIKLSSLLIRTVKASFILTLRFISRSLYYIALLPLFIWMGKQIKYVKKYTPFTWREFFIILTCLLAFIVISVAVCVFGVSWHWYAPPRAYCFMSFVFVAVTGYIGLRIAQTSDRNSAINASAVTSGLLLCVFFGYIIICDYPTLKEYNQYVRTRNSRIEERVLHPSENSSNAQLPFVCKPYSHHWNATTYSTMRNGIYAILGKSRRFYEPQVLLMESELTSDPSDFRNNGLQLYYKADFDIICLTDDESQN